MTTTAALLSQHQVTMDQARDWIMSHLDDPAEIFNTARAIGLDSGMLAQIISPALPGVRYRQVEDFFSSNGLRGSDLHYTLSDSDKSLISEGLASLLPSVMTMNTHSGVLSTAALRQAALDALPNDASYNALFDPANYEGAADHYFSAEDLGIPGHPGFAATAENFESIYYGTMIKTFQAVDYEELMSNLDFQKQHDFTELRNNPELIKEYTALLVSIHEKPAVIPVYTDQNLAMQIELLITSQADAGQMGQTIGFKAIPEDLFYF